MGASYRQLLLVNYVSLLIFSFNTAYRVRHGFLRFDIAPRLHHLIVHEVIWVNKCADFFRVQFVILIVYIWVQIWFSAIRFWRRVVLAIFLLFAHMTLFLNYLTVFGPIPLLPFIFKSIHFLFDFYQLLGLFVYSQVRRDPRIDIWLFLFWLSSLIHRRRNCSLDILWSILLHSQLDLLW